MLRQNISQIYHAILEKKLILLVLLFLALAAILEIRDQAEFYHSEALSLVMLHVKFENHECSGFREQAI